MRPPSKSGRRHDPWKPSPQADERRELPCETGSPTADGRRTHTVSRHHAVIPTILVADPAADQLERELAGVDLEQLESAVLEFDPVLVDLFLCQSWIRVSQISMPVAVCSEPTITRVSPLLGISCIKM